MPHSSKHTRLEFRNRLGDKFNLDNDDIENNHVVLVEKPIAHADIRAELSGIELESMQISEHSATIEEIIPSENEIAFESAANDDITGQVRRLYTGVLTTLLDIINVSEDNVSVSMQEFKPKIKSESV